MKLATDSILNILPSVLGIVVGIVTVPFYISLIGTERYGALAIAWLLLGYFGQADFGMGRAIAQRIGSMQNGPRSAMAGALWSALVSVSAFGLLGGILIYSGGTYFFNDLFKAGAGVRTEMMASMVLLALCVPLIAINGVFCGALTGLARFRLVAASNVISNITSQVLPLLVAAWYSNELKYLIGAALIGRLAGMFLAAIGATKTFLAGEPIAPTRSEFRHLAGFGAWITVTAFVGPLMTMSDRFVIGATLGAQAVTAYTVPYQVAVRTVLFPNGVVQALFPRMAAGDHAGSSALNRASIVFIGQTYALAVVGLICLAGPLMVLWLGSHLDPSSIVIGQILLVGFWFNALANVPYSFLQARGSPRFTALLHVAELPVYFGLLYALGENFDLAGVAAAFSLRCLLDCAILMIRAGLWTSGILRKLAVPASLIGLATWLTYGSTATAECLAYAVGFGGLALFAALIQMPEEVRQSIAASALGRLLPGFARTRSIDSI